MLRKKVPIAKYERMVNQWVIGLTLPNLPVVIVKFTEKRKYNKTNVMIILNAISVLNYVIIPLFKNLI